MLNDGILGLNAFLIFCVAVPLLIMLVGITVYILLSGRRSVLLFHFALVCLSLMIWQLSLLLRVISPDPLRLWLIICLQYLGLCLFALTLTLFGVADLMGGRITIRIMAPISLMPALIFLLILTNPLHHWFLQSFQAMDQVSGPVFAGVGTLLFVYLFSGFLLCCIGIWRQLHHKRFLAIALCILLMLPVVVFQAHVIGLVPLHFAAIPQLFTGAIIIYSLAAMRFHFLDITPLARRIIMNEIDTALVMTRLDNRIIDTNLAFSRLFESIGPISYLAPISRLCPALQVGSFETLPIRREIALETPSGHSLFEWTVQNICSRSGQPVGRMHQLTELENERQLRQLLAGQNEQLETANQSLQRHAEIASDLRSMTVRNRLAREMHDSLGHLLIILIAQLERILTEPDETEINKDEPDHEAAKREKDRQKGLQQVADLLRQVLDQLPEQISLNPAEGSSAHGDSLIEKSLPDNLTGRLRSMAEDLRKSGLSMEVQLRGPVEDIPTDHDDDLIGICREAVTNAVKHGKATTINLFVIAGQRQYELVILDNGTGKPDFVKGFGLINMEKRVTSLSGKLRLQSDTSGFGVYAAIPWPDTSSTDDVRQTGPAGSDL